MKLLAYFMYVKLSHNKRILHGFWMVAVATISQETEIFCNLTTIFNPLEAWKWKNPKERTISLFMQKEGKKFVHDVLYVPKLRQKGKKLA